MTKQTLAMSFQSQTVTTFVKLNLTDLGRRKMALGTFSVSRAIFSDREVRYAFNRRYPVKDPVFTNMNPTSDRLYDIENNKVLAPAFAAPGLPPRNYDGSQPYQIGERIVASTQVLTARTESRGLWSAVTEGSNQAIGQYIVDQSKTIATAVTASNLFLGTNQVFSIGTAHTGNFAFIRQRTPTTLQPDTESDAPIMGLWYRIVDGTNSIKLDRDVGIFNSGTVPIPVYCYPASATTDYWNSGTTAPGEVWSLNIVRTSNMIGSDAQ
ncbi:MAG: hypothetical protein P8J32_06335, partial [bacterium]|nr:hypothetical protein [bacterium]